MIRRISSIYISWNGRDVPTVVGSVLLNPFFCYPLWIFKQTVQNSPSFCLGLVFLASSPLMVTLTMCVVLFDKPGSKQRAANKHRQKLSCQKHKSGTLTFYQKLSQRCILIQEENTYLAYVQAGRVVNTLSSQVLKSSVSVPLSAFTDPL